MIMDSGLSVQYPTLLAHVQNFDYSIIDTNGHGTHVTDTILRGACPQVKITVCKYWDKSWSRNKIYQEYYNCYKKALALKVDIINYSGGGYGEDKEEAEFMRKFKQKGILLVTAAGNDGWDIDVRAFYPAAYEYSNIIAVGNLRPDGKIAHNSNYGNRVVWTLGTDVEALGLNGLEKMSGTSMAAANYTNGLVRRFCKGLK